MELTGKLLKELQNRLKVGNRRSVHLNAIPSRSRYKFDLSRLSHIDKNLPTDFIEALLVDQPLRFKISWKDNVPDLNTLFEEDQMQIVKITKSFENLINQTEAIESEKGINTFGFGFPLLIRRDQADNKLTVAPILIWSLRIKRTKQFNTWVIERDDDDPIYINEVLINHLQNDSKIEINQISSEMLDDGLIDKEEFLDICVNLIESINSTTEAGLRETFKQSLLNVKKISERSHYEKLPLTSNKSIIEFGGLFSIFEVQKQNIINDYNNLIENEGEDIDIENMDKHSFQSISSVETDPSQQSILHSLESTRNILIQGPPGTGKSQSLTAILINALENHKKTIVVCEKRTALEVLHNSLNEKGLHFHCSLIKDIVKDRRTVVESVRSRVDNSSYRSSQYTYSKESLDNIIKTSSNVIDRINRSHKKIGEKVLGEKNWTDTVGTLLNSLRENNEEPHLNLDSSVFNYNAKEFNHFIDLVKSGHNYFIEYEKYKDLTFLRANKLKGDNPFLIEQQIEADFSSYKKSLKEIKKKIEEFEEEYILTRKKEIEDQINSITEIIKTFSVIINEYRNRLDLLIEDKTSKISYKISALFNREKRETLKGQNKLYKAFDNLLKTIKQSPDIDNVDFSFSLIKDIEKLKELENVFKSINLKFNDKVKNELKKLDLFDYIPFEYKTEGIEEIISKANGLSSIISTDNWSSIPITLSSNNDFIDSVELLIKMKENYFFNKVDVFTIEFKWHNYYNNLSDLERELIDELKSKKNWEKVFIINYLNNLLNKAANKNLLIGENEYEELDSSLSGLKREQLNYIRGYWYSKQIDEARKFETSHPNLSVENLYNKRSSNRYKRLSLRQIIKYDKDLFTTFSPIILTTPDVCSNLFSGENKYFDIVMFDEASQLRLEDNLPALLKGKQVVIAGDEHQMPPSNYFDKIFDGIAEDEEDIEDEDKVIIDRDNILLSCESLLDFATELSFEKKYLDFHYRSRHPYLIDFSNNAFYNKRLQPLPNNFEYIPIKYIQINGTFSDHTNEAEAEAVLAIIDKNIHRLPNGEYPTIGVATFNIAQRNLIKSKIIERRKFSKFQEFNEKLFELEENGLFVKNLENIQGDERDVIILSTTYGINKDGKFTHRFGPINHKKGYKLLNVIITRAKYKVYVCSSIPEEVFLNYKEYLSIEGSNNRRAVFFSYLAYTKAVSDGNNEQRLAVLSSLLENTNQGTAFGVGNADLESPFEEEVYQELADNFDESKLIPQLQFAGFRIDIVYDSKKEGVPKIAIECDGATYHSSREAYLYDRHRQKILEGHGFVFHRIWSTNWWRNPKRESENLIEFINNIESQTQVFTEDKTNSSIAFTDDFNIIEKYTSKILLQFDDKKDEAIITSLIKDNDDQDEEIITSIETEKYEQTILFEDAVNKNSKVLVKYLNNDKDIRVHIVESENNKIIITNGVQNIYYKSPLAVSLLGKRVGDTVKVGNLDNYVEILEIAN